MEAGATRTGVAGAFANRQLVRPWDGLGDTKRSTFRGVKLKTGNRKSADRLCQFCAAMLVKGGTGVGLILSCVKDRVALGVLVSGVVERACKHPVGARVVHRQYASGNVVEAPVFDDREMVVGRNRDHRYAFGSQFGACSGDALLSISITASILGWPTNLNISSPRSLL